MASSGQQAWIKHFKGKGDITTTVAEDSNLYDDTTGKSLSRQIKKGTEIVYLDSKVYETPARIKYKVNNRYVTARIPFNNIQKPLRQEKVTKSSLKPKDISPSIVDIWLTPQEIVENVKQYLKKLSLSEEDRKAMNNLLDLTVKDSSSSIDVGNMDKNLVPSEFYEILTSVKLAVLMRSNDAKVRQILGVPKKLDLSKCKIKIMIPKMANMPLLDYYISIAVGNNPEEKVMRISVKSKVASSSTNTVKFNDAFKDNKELSDWYNSLSNKKGEIGQKIIAESAINAPSGKALIYPITALDKLFDARKDLAMRAMKEFRKPEGFDSTLFRAAVATLSRKMKLLVKKNTLDTAIDSDKQLNELIRFMKMNLTQKGNKPITDFTIENASFMCEKIIVKASQEELKSIGGGMNFYQLFYDQVLKKREIAYAVADKTGSRINYKFYSKVNWKSEYSDWISLRSKNLINNLNDTLGMDI